MRDQQDLDDLAAMVRQRREQAVGAIPTPRPPGCPVCFPWVLRPGEHRDEHHVTTCPLVVRA